MQVAIIGTAMWEAHGPGAAAGPGTIVFGDADAAARAIRYRCFRRGRGRGGRDDPATPFGAAGDVIAAARDSPERC